MKDRLSVVGKSLPRIDALDKVTGRAKYGIDLRVDDMLYAKLLRSPYPHARVKAIDTTRAKNHPRVRAPQSSGHIHYRGGSKGCRILVESPN
jgi:CO/xanthine dehydrogenase Mo-binding subunit